MGNRPLLLKMEMLAIVVSACMVLAALLRAAGALDGGWSSAPDGRTFDACRYYYRLGLIR